LRFDQILISLSAMQTRTIPALIALFSRAMFAQSSAVEPLGAFDLLLEQRAGPSSSVEFFVARNSHLYFVVSGTSGSLAFQTEADGTVQNTASLGPEPISGFEVDRDGISFLLRGNSRLTEFDSAWKVGKELSLPSPIVSFALMEGRPMGVGADSRVFYLDTQEGALQLEEYPPPWVLFTAGPHRLGILRPKASSLHLIRGEDEISVALLGADIRARKPFAASAGPGNKVYLLGSPDRAGSASVIECDEHLSPRLILDFALSDAFHARMIGITSGRIYLADPAGKVAFYPLDPKPSAAQVIDSAPHLLSDMEPVRRPPGEPGSRGELISTWTSVKTANHKTSGFRVRWLTFPK
jgi:hypothetical protein